MKQFLVILFAILTTAHGQVVMDGDFITGGGAWKIAGQLVKLDANGEPIKPVKVDEFAQAFNSGTSFRPDTSFSSDTKKPSVFGFSLAPAQFTEIHQRFFRLHGEEGMKLTIVLRVSSNFVRYGDAPCYNSDWKAGGAYVWSGGIKYPPVDLTIRVDSKTHYYRLHNLTTGGGWQTVTAEFAEMGSLDDAAHPKELALIFPAGKGTVRVKSVTIEPL
jgi:hypothetical protein